MFFFLNLFILSFFVHLITESKPNCENIYTGINRWVPALHHFSILLQLYRPKKNVILSCKEKNNTLQDFI